MRTTIRSGLLATTESRFGSKLSIQLLKTSWDWPGDRYNEIKLHVLSPTLTSNLKQFCK